MKYQLYQTVLLLFIYMLVVVDCNSNASFRPRHGTHWNRIGKRERSTTAATAVLNRDKAWNVRILAKSGAESNEENQLAILKSLNDLTNTNQRSVIFEVIRPRKKHADYLYPV